MQLQLFLQAENLKNKAGLFKGISDPYAVVYKAGSGHAKIEQGRTEVVKNNLSPEWSRSILIDNYDPNSFDWFIVQIYDEVRKSEDILMDETYFQINDQLIFDGHGNGNYLVNLIDDKDKKSKLKVYAEVKPTWTDQPKVTFQFRALQVKNVDNNIFNKYDKSDPYLVIKRRQFNPDTGSIHWQIIHRTEHIENHVNPVWQSFQVSWKNLFPCQCRHCIRNPNSRIQDWDALDPSNVELKFEIWDHQYLKKNRIIGTCQKNLKEVIDSKTTSGNADKSKAFTFVEDSENPHNVKTVGLLVVLCAKIIV
mmetsp:Transcript_977/g.1469  ORF Transcript_977/g.1469 Transcript_977/m.1469 type:complete len:308 (-) Transcript_977:22-945(-)